MPHTETIDATGASRATDIRDDTGTSRAAPAADAETAPLLPLSALLPDFESRARALHEARENACPLGPLTRFSRLDRAVGGALQPGAHIVHGVPGAGKTGLLLQIAAVCGCPALFVTCEIPPAELLLRIAARVTGTYLGRFKTGELPPEKAVALAMRAVEATPRLALLDGTAAYPTPARILESAELTRRLDPESPHLLVALDSLHSWADGAPGALAEYERLAAHIAALKALAARLRCPIIAVAERNRASMERGGLSAGAGHRGIEYGAESVLDLERRMEELPDPDGEVGVTLRLNKNRHGVAGDRIELKYNGGLQSFREAGR